VIVLENDVSINSLQTSKIPSFDEKRSLKCAMESIETSSICRAEDVLFYLQTEKIATLMTIFPKQNKFPMFYVKIKNRKSMKRSITKKCFI